MVAAEKRTISMAVKQAYSDAPGRQGSPCVNERGRPGRAAALQEHDAAVGRWLRDEVALTYDGNAGPPIARRPARPGFQTLHSHHGKRSVKHSVVFEETRPGDPRCPGYQRQAARPRQLWTSRERPRLRCAGL